MAKEVAYAFCKRLLDNCKLKDIIKTPVGVQKFLHSIYNGIEKAQEAKDIDKEFLQILLLKNLGFDREYIKHFTKLRNTVRELGLKILNSESVTLDELTEFRNKAIEFVSLSKQVRDRYKNIEEYFEELNKGFIMGVEGIIDKINSTNLKFDYGPENDSE